MVFKTIAIVCVVVAVGYGLPTSQVSNDLHGTSFSLKGIYPFGTRYRWKRHPTAGSDLMVESGEGSNRGTNNANGGAGSGSGSGLGAGAGMASGGLSGSSASSGIGAGGGGGDSSSGRSGDGSSLGAGGGGGQGESDAGSSGARGNCTHIPIDEIMRKCKELQEDLQRISKMCNEKMIQCCDVQSDRTSTGAPETGTGTGGSNSAGSSTSGTAAEDSESRGSDDPRTVGDGVSPGAPTSGIATGGSESIGSSNSPTVEAKNTGDSVNTVTGGLPPAGSLTIGTGSGGSGSPGAGGSGSDGSVSEPKSESETTESRPRDGVSPGAPTSGTAPRDSEIIGSGNPPTVEAKNTGGSVNESGVLPPSKSQTTVPGSGDSGSPVTGSNSTAPDGSTSIGAKTTEPESEDSRSTEQGGSPNTTGAKTGTDAATESVDADGSNTSSGNIGSINGSPNNGQGSPFSQILITSTNESGQNICRENPQNYCVCIHVWNRCFTNEP